MSSGVHVDGLDALRRNLSAAGADLADLADVHTEVGRIVNTKAAGLAPRRTGALAASLRAAADRSAVAMGSSLPYAGVIHWGSKRRNIRPTPFLLTAISATEAAWTKVYTDRIETVLTKVANHG